jgi:uncharacterized protein YndB with AHSA1/START domain
MAPATEAAIADGELLITRRFKAPVAVVWRMWESRDHIARWWGPEGFTVTEFDLDFRPGGKWRSGMVSAIYPKSWSSGTFIEIVPRERIVMSFAWEEGSGEATDTTITVTFEEKDGETIQHFHQTPFETVDARDSHIGGWNSQFNKEEKYATALARGVELDPLS